MCVKVKYHIKVTYTMNIIYKGYIHIYIYIYVCICIYYNHILYMYI